MLNRKRIGTQNNVHIKIGKHGVYFEVLTLELYDDGSFKVCAKDQQWYSYGAGVKLEVEGVQFP